MDTIVQMKKSCGRYVEWRFSDKVLYNSDAW